MSGLALALTTAAKDAKNRRPSTSKVSSGGKIQGRRKYSTEELLLDNRMECLMHSSVSPVPQSSGCLNRNVESLKSEENRGIPIPIRGSKPPSQCSSLAGSPMSGAGRSFNVGSPTMLSPSSQDANYPSSVPTNRSSRATSPGCTAMSTSVQEHRFGC